MNRAGPGASASLRQALRTLLLPLGVAVGVLVVVTGAVWGASSGSAGLPAAGPGQLSLPGGLVRVDQVVSAAPPMMAMPGMGTDQDPVPEGERRVSVDVTLLATGGDVLSYDVDQFSLEVPGAGASGPHRAVLPGSEMPEGTRLSGTLIFDVPIDATAGVLGYAGLAGPELHLPPASGADSSDPAEGGAHGGAGGEPDGTHAG